MRSQIIMHMAMHEEKFNSNKYRLLETKYMDLKDEPYSPTDFINQSLCRKKSENGDSTSPESVNSARSGFFLSTRLSETSGSELVPPSTTVAPETTTSAFPATSKDATITQKEIIRPIPMIPLDPVAFTSVLAQPTYLENPPHLPVAPSVIMSGSNVKSVEEKESCSPPHAPMFTDSQEQENMELQTSVHECHWLNCQETFSQMNELVNHVNDCHVKVERPDVDYQCKWNSCPRRGKGFNARYKMLIHIRTHTNEKPHRCTLCGKSFSRLENLKIHNRSHTGEKPYICPFPGCTKAYSNSSDRFKHVRTHQEDKPYICKMPGCSKRYTDPSSLRKHVRTHGHYFRENGQTENSSSVHSTSPNSQNNGTDSLSPPSSINLAVPSGTQNLQSPMFHFSLSSIDSGHVERLVQLQRLASNPLLSSTIITNSVLTNTISTQTDGVVTVKTQMMSPHSSPRKGFGEGALLESEEKCQDCPLDLTTSPVDLIPSQMTSPTSPSRHEVGEEETARWEVMNS